MIEHMFDHRAADATDSHEEPTVSLATVDDRLIPLNAFIGLCVPDHLWPSPLAEAGYVLAGIEVPVGVNDRRVVFDAVAFRQTESRVLGAEAKSGRNVDTDQAQRYQSVQVDDVVRAANISVRQPGPRSLQTLYACLAQNLERILLGLRSAGVDFPILAVADDAITHQGRNFDDPDLQRLFDGPQVFVGAPPRYVPVDLESSDEEFDRLVLATLVEDLSHARRVVEVPVLAARAINHLPLYGTAARNQLERRVDEAAQRIASADPDSFIYMPATGTRHSPSVEFVRSPEDLDPRGRTQSYQAIARAGIRRPRRRREVAGQRSIDELLAELEKVSQEDEEEE
jgi:hypothetical protein